MKTIGVVNISNILTIMFIIEEKIEHGIRYGENQIDNAQDESSLSVKEFHFRLSKSSPATPNCWISHIL